MKVFISADIEGCTGLVSWKQCGGPTAEHYDFDFARRMYHHDVNAAIRGAKAAGADTVVVKDSHNVGRNLLIDQLEPGTELISGDRASPDGMVEGIDPSFQALFLVGYHARAGTLQGIMEHTISGRVHRLFVNGEEVGEQALSAATAARYGVPIALVTSGHAGILEANHFFPWAQTVTVKYGLGRHQARLLHPSATGPLIEQAAKTAVENIAHMRPYQAEPPYRVALEFNRAEEADEAAANPGWERQDAYTIAQTLPDWPQAHTAIRRAMASAANAALY